MNTITIKTEDEIEIMSKGGEKLAEIKKEVASAIKPGVNAMQVEELTTDLIKKRGGKPSFKMVPGYKWSTCVNVNEGLVHGIPKDNVIFTTGDVVSVDIGIFFKDFHTDTSITVAISPSGKITHMLDTGKSALKKAIERAIPGGRVYDISKAIQEEIEKGGYTPVRALVGHGIGRDLHEGPQIPCFVRGTREKTPEIKDGMVLAIEVMYTMSKEDVKVEADGWTISMRDGKISALYEDTVAITAKGPKVLT